MESAQLFQECLCSRFRIFRFLFFPPGGAQGFCARRKSFFQEIRRLDTIRPKMPERLAQFTPSNNQPHGFKISHRDRPDDTVAVAAIIIAVLDFQQVSAP